LRSSCNGELALGNADLSACRAGDVNGDSQITVDEILTAVNNALRVQRRLILANKPLPFRGRGREGM